MSTTVACPTCAGPVELDGTSTVQCLIGHHVTPEDLSAAIDDVTSRALWAAVRSLEDAASAARWRQTMPEAPTWLSAQIAAAERDAVVLRGLLDHREGADADTDTRPNDW